MYACIPPHTDYKDPDAHWGREFVRAGHIQARVKHAPNLPEDGMWSPKGGKIESRSPPRYEENVKKKKRIPSRALRLPNPLHRTQKVWSRSRLRLNTRGQYIGFPVRIITHVLEKLKSAFNSSVGYINAFITSAEQLTSKVTTNVYGA